MLDPTIIAAIVTVLGTAGNTLWKQWIESGQEATPQSEEAQAERAIEAVYDKLRPELTDRLVRLLVLQSGHTLPPDIIAKRLYPNTPPSKTLEREIEYRCKFLVLLGLMLQVGGSRYTTTTLGRSFLTVAKTKGDYKDVNFDASGA